MGGKGPRGNNAAFCSQLACSHFLHYSQFPVLIPGWVGCVCVCSRTLWVSPKKSPVRLGAFPASSTSTGFFQRFWGFISLWWKPGLYGQSRSLVVLPVLSARKCGTVQSLQPLPCHESSPPWLPISTPPASLDECFFFNSLVVGLPYSWIFCQFWLIFVFKFVDVHLLVVQGGKVYLPTPPSWPEVGIWLLFKTG